jgi:hypothetical protein
MAFFVEISVAFLTFLGDFTNLSLSGSLMFQELFSTDSVNRVLLFLVFFQFFFSFIAQIEDFKGFVFF